MHPVISRNDVNINLHHGPEMDIDGELAQIIPMEVELVVLKVVKYLLNRNVPFQRHVRAPTCTVRSGILKQEEEGLHVLQIGRGRQGIFLTGQKQKKENN